MEFTCTQENLLQGLSQVVPVAGRNAQLPILQNILLQVREGVLHLTGTDLEVGVHGMVGGKASSEGSCAVSARQLFEYVQQLPTAHPIKLKKIKRGLAISTEGYRASFQVADPDDFPLLPEVGDTAGVSLSAETLSTGLGDALFAAAREETRPEIHSVFVKGEGKELRVAATDSFRLAERVIPLEGNGNSFSFLLPLSAAQEVIRLFSGQEKMELLPHDNTIAFRGEGIELSSRLVDGTYPDYHQIIPKDWKTRIEVDREEFVRALKTLLVFLPRDSRRVRMVVDPSNDTMGLKVEGGEIGEGDVQLGVTGEGEEVELLVNIQYMLEGVQHIRSERCEVEFGGAEAPVVFHPVGENNQYIYVVMPIQA